MTPFASAFLIVTCITTIALVVRAMVRHDKRHRGRGLPADVRYYDVAGPALGGSIWVGPQSTAGEVDARRLDGPTLGVGTAPREGWTRGVS